MLDDLTGVLRSYNITFLETTPTVLSLVDISKVSTLKTVYSSGEPLTVRVREMFRSTPNITLANGGAPTETTVMSVFTIIDPMAQNDIRTFGRPFGGNRAYVLSKDGTTLCPAGAVGYLWIGGPQVSRGYLGRDDLTSAVYRNDPYGEGRMYNTGDLCSWTEDGVLLYLGRGDAQVKIRGQRIETGEIEGALTEMDGVRAASVVKTVDSDHDREELVAFVELEEVGFSDLSSSHT